MEAISSFPRPTDLRQLQRFLGLINFYRRFLPAIAGILKLLTDLLRGAPKKLLWSSDADAAFTKAKAALVAAVPLSHPAPGAILSLAVDASDTHVGGVLQQLRGRSWQPLAFFSKKLSPTQARLLHIRPRALGGVFGGPPLPLPLGGLPFHDRPQTSRGGHVQSFAAVIRQAAAPDSLPGGIHRQFLSYSRGDKCRRRRSFAAFGPLHRDHCTAGAYQPNPASLRRCEGTRRRAAPRDGKTAAGPAAQLRRRCNSGIESSRGSGTLTSSGAAHSGLLPRRRCCAASGFCLNCSSTVLLPRCGLYASLHGSLHCLKTRGRASVARRCVHRRIPPAPAAAVPRRRLPLLAQHCTPRDPSNLPPGFFKVLLASDEQTDSHGSVLPPLPAQQSAQACSLAARAN